MQHEQKNKQAGSNIKGGVTEHREVIVPPGQDLGMPSPIDTLTAHTGVVSEKGHIGEGDIKHDEATKGLNPKDNPPVQKPPVQKS